jgi:hypothetical protein
MKTFIISFLLVSLRAHAALTITDKNKLATVTLHTELIEASKRVYLAADFEASHTQGMIGCKLTLQHKNGQENGPTYQVEEESSLLPNEKIPFNLGLFPEKFHASGIDVKAHLVCNKITFFNRPQAKPVAQKALLKSTAPATETVGRTCCRMSPIKIICSHVRSDGSVDVGKSTQLHAGLDDPSKYEPCYPTED